MKNILLFFVCVFLFSCNKSNNQSENKATTVDRIPKKEKKFEMYELSEMAALMEQMYVDNERLKKRIKNGDTIGKFPNHFLKIHKAVMTDSTDNDAFFKQQANAFIKAQTLIYEDPKNAKLHFNDGVSACVACHQVKCSGPIPRIKKLYIE
jgi:hypothetical protein